VDLRVARLVVFGDAAVDAAAAADAAGDIEREGEMDTGHRALVGDLDVFAELFLVAALHLRDGGFQLVLGDFIEPLGAAGGEDHACEGGSGAGGEHAPRGLLGVGHFMLRSGRCGAGLGASALKRGW